MPPAPSLPTSLPPVPPVPPVPPRVPTTLGALAFAMAIAAATLPSLLAYNVSPSPTFWNQALAFALWAAFVGLSAPAWPQRGVLPLLAALGLLTLCAVAAWAPGALPGSLALSCIGTLLAAAVLAAGGAGMRWRAQPAAVFAAFCWAWVVAGVLNLGLALVQVFLPDGPDGVWIAASGLPGRAVGNLRQPNHLSSLLLWACIAVVALLELGRLGRRGWRWAWPLLAGLVFAVVLTASRTGLVSVLLLAVWGLLDRRLSRPARGLLLAAPLLYAAAWGAMAGWASVAQHSFGGSQRLAESDVSGSRFGIWRDTLTLIAQQPWLGVGFGEFNFAWTMTPLPQRPVAFFDHTHNLPLQLAVELGLPLASAVLALLGWALWRGLRLAWQADGAASVAQRSAMLMVVMVGVHSLLEYPLWYSYFLLPAAWAWGLALRGDAGPGGTAAATPPSRAMAAAAWVVVAGTALAVADYSRVAAIFSADAGSGPLEKRIAAGQRSLFFAHHADYAAVTAAVAADLPAADADRALAGATHYLLDTRLMMAWAQARARRGDVDGARYIAARLREFRNADAAEFFADCPGAARPAAPGLPFQCELPQAAPGWRAFLKP